MIERERERESERKRERETKAFLASSDNLGMVNRSATDYVFLRWKSAFLLFQAWVLELLDPTFFFFIAQMHAMENARNVPQKNQ